MLNQKTHNKIKEIVPLTLYHSPYTIKAANSQQIEMESMVTLTLLYDYAQTSTVTI